MKLCTAAPLALLLALAGQAGAASVEVLVRTPAGAAVADAAVLVEPLVPTQARSRAKAAIEQRGAEFYPWMSIVQVGTSVDFPNNDTVRHHVYSFSAPKRFEIKLYAGKPGQPIVFDKPGVVSIGCNIHDWMEAWVLVAETPYFTRTTPDGRATVRNVPPGRYRVRLWHPLQNGVAPVREVEVGAAPLRLQLALDARPRQPKPHTEVDSDNY
jgi:plastocyanin